MTEGPAVDTPQGPGRSMTRRPQDRPATGIVLEVTSVMRGRWLLPSESLLDEGAFSPDPPSTVRSCSVGLKSHRSNEL